MATQGFLPHLYRGGWKRHELLPRSVIEISGPGSRSARRIGSVDLAARLIVDVRYRPTAAAGLRRDVPLPGIRPAPRNPAGTRLFCEPMEVAAVHRGREPDEERFQQKWRRPLSGLLASTTRPAARSASGRSAGPKGPFPAAAEPPEHAGDRWETGGPSPRSIRKDLRWALARSPRRLRLSDTR